MKKIFLFLITFNFLSSEANNNFALFSRKWLYWFCNQNENFLGHHEIKKNLFYYKSMINNHLSHAQNKKENLKIYKKRYLKTASKYGLLSLAGLLLSGYEFYYSGKIINKNELLGVSIIFTSIFTFMAAQFPGFVSIENFYKYFKLEKKLNNRIDFDKYILQKIEEYEQQITVGP